MFAIKIKVRIFVSTNKNNKVMEYTTKQIENAKKAYNSMLRFKSISDYDVNSIGYEAASQRMEYHNSIVSAILGGNKEEEKKWKLFFLKEEVKADKESMQSKSKLDANKAASSDIIAPIKAIKKLGEFGKWLNTPGNPYRSENFSKKYTSDSVNAFLQTL